MAAAAASTTVTAVAHLPAPKKRKAPLPDWDDVEVKLKAGLYAKTDRLNVEITNLCLHQILLAQNDRFHLLYSHNIRLKLVDAPVDAELMARVALRWKQHAVHPMVTGLVSTGVAPTHSLQTVAAAVTQPLVYPPIGPDPALLFTLH